MQEDVQEEMLLEIAAGIRRFFQDEFLSWKGTEAVELTGWNNHAVAFAENDVSGSDGEICCSFKYCHVLVVGLYPDQLSDTIFKLGSTSLMMAVKQMSHAEVTKRRRTYLVPMHRNYEEMRTRLPIVYRQ